jgi:16S rRNA (cytosine967-C5)-methyltransferase
VKPGGKLFYAVCTLTRSETTDVMADFNGKFAAEFEPVTLPKVWGNQPTPGATMTIWPQDLGGNGMFIAAWQRKKT